jgi:hypothetical protein
MTEADWQSCSEPQEMLGWLKGQSSNRKWRLFACAIARVVWTSLVPYRVRRAVEVAERFADGQATERDLRRAYSEACESTHSAVMRGSLRRVGHPLQVSERRLYFAAEAAHPGSPSLIRRQLPIEADGELIQADGELKAVSPFLLRDVFGPLPFRPVPLPPSVRTWNSGTVVRLAQAAYDGRQLPTGTLEHERLMVLADALEEAGCRDQEVLAHLREPGGVHVRGCYVVDLLLGKS